MQLQKPALKMLLTCLSQDIEAKTPLSLINHVLRETVLVRS